MRLLEARGHRAQIRLSDAAQHPDPRRRGCATGGDGDDNAVGRRAARSDRHGNRREENLQNVPITIQVLTGETLAKLNATTFDDVVKYLPAMTAHGVGPSQNSIYVRGLEHPTRGFRGRDSVVFSRTWRLYLDEQSAQLPRRNLDVYAADLERIEVVEGPQGTLFGRAPRQVSCVTSPQAEAQRHRSHRDRGIATTAHGDQSSNVDATLNIPLIADTLALRGVIYSEKRGGYINNVPEPSRGPIRTGYCRVLQREGSRQQRRDQ